jgi:dihydrolipoamide dehydrogenase
MAEGTRIVIIGGGVAGYPAAIRASHMGADVTLIERDALGGTCLNWGCVPTKALLQVASVVRTVKSADLFGIRCHGYEVDFGAVMNRKDAVVSRLTRGVGALLKARKINVVQGTASFVDSKTVQVNETGENIRADAILIATGSKPCRIPVEGINGPDVMDSNQVLSMTSLPTSVVVIGGGVIGVEFAQFLAAMGTRVTILELTPGLVPGVDRELASLLEKRTIMSGIEIVTGAAVRGIVRTGKENVVTYTVGDKTATASADKVILTVGRRPDFSLIDVDRVGVRHENGAIIVDEHMQTNVPGIYAAGDVVGGIMLAHLASAEGECAVANALGRQSAMSYRAVPSCIYTSPEVASVGLTEEQARQTRDVRVGRFPFRANGKAVVLNELEGMAKIVSDGTSGEVLGVHIIGPHATDLIAEAVLGIRKGMTAADFAHTIHPHPTLSEVIMEAAMTLTGGAIHLP